MNDDDGAFNAFVSSSDVVVELFKQLIPGVVTLSFVVDEDDHDMGRSLVTLGQVRELVPE